MLGSKKKKQFEGPVLFGDLVRDKITGFEGIATGYTDFFYGCRRIMVQPRVLKKDGDTAKSHSFDEPQLEILDRGLIQARPSFSDNPVEMGDEVEDLVTGFKGIVVVIATFAFSCRRIGVQPQKLKKDGDGIAEDQFFDEGGLKITKRKKIPIVEQAPIGNDSTGNPVPPGGPERYKVTRNQPATRP